MKKQDVIRLAHRGHEIIEERLRAIRQSKIEVYVLLREFKRAKLYRWLDVPIAPQRLRRICAESRRRTHHEEREGHEATKHTTSAACPEQRRRACPEPSRRERRSPTWEDYLASLGRWGISFGYFAELERLERRFGTAFVRLCAAGIPVEVRRFLLRARHRERIDSHVRRVVGSDDADAAKVEELLNMTAVWQSEAEAELPRRQTPTRRASRYHRHVRHWERKLGELADQLRRVPQEVRTGPAYRRVATAWREVFAAHLEIGERLARACFTLDLGIAHWSFLHEVRVAWSQSPYGPKLPGVPSIPRRDIDAA